MRTEDIYILRLENAAFFWTAIKLEEIYFSSNFSIVFREVHRIRILTWNYFKITFGTVNNYEGIVFYYLRNWASYGSLKNNLCRILCHMSHASLQCLSSFCTSDMQHTIFVVLLSSQKVAACVFLLVVVLCYSEECWPGTVHSSTLTYFINSPSTDWILNYSWSVFSLCYVCILSWHSELRCSGGCEIASYIICLSTFNQSNRSTAFGLSSQPHPCNDCNPTLKSVVLCLCL
jgi:hypothetical protein